MEGEPDVFYSAIGLGGDCPLAKFPINVKTRADSEAKLPVPNPASILSRHTKIIKKKFSILFLYKMTFSEVMSCDLG